MFCFRFLKKMYLTFSLTNVSISSILFSLPRILSFLSCVLLVTLASEVTEVTELLTIFNFQFLSVWVSLLILFLPLGIELF